MKKGEKSNAIVVWFGVIDSIFFPSKYRDKYDMQQ